MSEIEGLTKILFATRGPKAMIEDRMARLNKAIRAATNDDARYAVGHKVRELGYLDFADFTVSKPPIEHIRQVERVLGL